MRSSVKRNLIVLAVAVGLGCATVSAFGDTIPVANPGFQIIPVRSKNWSVSRKHPQKATSSFLTI